MTKKSILPVESHRVETTKIKFEVKTQYSPAMSQFSHTQVTKAYLNALPLEFDISHRREEKITSSV